METSEETQHVDRTAELVNKELLPWLKTRGREEPVPDFILSHLKGSGLFGANIPKKYGGLGLSILAFTSIVRELSRGSIAFASLIFSQCKVSSYLINWGTDEQKEEWLPKLASGKILAAHALTEPAGKAVDSLTTTIRKEGDRYVLDGLKSFVTNAAIADLYVVVARHEFQEVSGCSVVFVSRNNSGLAVGKEIEKIGLQELSLAPIILKNCYVNKKDILGEWEKDATLLLATVQHTDRLSYVARAAGIAARAFDEADAFVRSKYSDKKLLIDIPAVGLRLAEIRAKVSCIDMILRDLSSQLQGGKVEPIDVCAAKIYCTKTAGEVVRGALELHGGAGYASDLPIGKLYRDVEALSIIGAPNDTIISNISNILVGPAAIGGKASFVSVTAKRQP